MHNHCFQFLLGNMGIIAVSREIEDNGYVISLFLGGGESKLGALWPMWKWWTQYFCSVFSPSNYKFILRHLPVWFGVFQHWKQNIYFRFYGDDCWLYQRSTSTINTIILGLRQVVFYDGSNWLITIRGWATKGKSTDFRLPELDISQIAFTAPLLLWVLIAN